jgi:hypothetical protein
VSFVQFNRSTAPNRDRQDIKQNAVGCGLRSARGQQEAALLPLGTVANIEQQRLGDSAAKRVGTRAVGTQSRKRDVRVPSCGRCPPADNLGSDCAHLRDATRVFVVPDGAIGLVPLAALPVEDHIVLARTLAADLLPVGGTGPRGHGRTRTGAGLGEFWPWAERLLARRVLRLRIAPAPAPAVAGSVSG